MSVCLLVNFSLSFSGTAPITGFPGLKKHTGSTGRPGFHSTGTTGAPGLQTTGSHGGIPGLATPSSSKFYQLLIISNFTSCVCKNAACVFVWLFKNSGLSTTSPSVYPGVTTGQPGLHLTTSLHPGKPGLQTTRGRRLFVLVSLFRQIKKIDRM